MFPFLLLFIFYYPRSWTKSNYHSQTGAVWLPYLSNSRHGYHQSRYFVSGLWYEIQQSSGFAGTYGYRTIPIDRRGGDLGKTSSHYGYEKIWRATWRSEWMLRSEYFGRPQDRRDSGLRGMDTWQARDSSVGREGIRARTFNPPIFPVHDGAIEGWWAYLE